MTTHELFQKHFGDVAVVDLKHPKMESFLGELAEICNKENEQRLLQEKENENRSRTV